MRGKHACNTVAGVAEGRAVKRLALSHLALFAPLLAASLALPGCYAGSTDRDTSQVDNGDDVFINGTCRLDAHCGPGFSCELGVCVEGCVEDNQCDDGLVCADHGRCLDPDAPETDPLIAALAAPIEIVPETSIGLVPGTGKAYVTIVNPGIDALEMRLESNASALGYDDAAFEVGPGETMEIEIDVDEDALDDNAHQLPISFITETGTVDHLIVLAPQSTGHYIGQLLFKDGAAMVGDSQGTSSLGLNLEFLDDGTVAGETFSDESFLFPRNLTVEGSWNDEGQVSITLRDIVPSELPTADVALDDEYGLGGLPDSPFARDIGRELVFHGTFDEHGTSLEGDFDEFLTGIFDKTIVTHGTFVFHQVGEMRGSSGEAIDFGAELPLAAPEWDWPEDFDGGLCDGLGVELGKSIEACTEACLEEGCSRLDAQECAAELLEAGDMLTETILLGDFSVEVDNPSTSFPESWIECTEGNDDFPCLDPELIRCSGALYRFAVTDLVDQGNLTWTHARSEMLDQFDSETTMDGMLGLTDVVDAGLAFLENLPSEAAEAELAALKAAQDHYERPTMLAVAPGTLRTYVKQGGGVLSGTREGKDITNSVAVASNSMDALALQLRLLRRARPGNRDELRRAASDAANWMHIYGATMTDQMVTFEVQDEMSETLIFVDAIDRARRVYDELAPGTNPFGFQPSHVPILLSGEHAESGVSNYELVRDASQGSRTLFTESAAQAKVSLDAFENNLYDSQEKAATLMENYDTQLIELCGVDELDPSEPNLTKCGADGGRISILKDEVKSAEVQVDKAMVALKNNVKAIDIREDAMSQKLANAEELDVDLEDINGELVNIVNKKNEKISARNQSHAMGQCGNIIAKATNEVVRTTANAVNNATAAMGESAPIWWSGASTGAKITAEASINSTAIAVNAGLDCEQALSDAGHHSGLSQINGEAETETLLKNREMDAKIRASSLEDQMIDHKATIETMALQNELLRLDIELASLGVKSTSTNLKNAWATVASLLVRKNRAQKRLTQDPKNPYLNPSFLVVRNETGRRLGADRETALRWTYRAGRALEFELNRDLPVIEARLYPARSPSEVEHFAVCMDNIHNEYKIAYGSPQEHVTEISLRRDVFGLLEPIVDPETHEEVSPGAQFAAMLDEPDHILDDGSREISLALPLLGDTAQVSELLCDDRIRSIEVKLVGDFLGDEAGIVMLTRDGSSELRRCDAEDLAKPDQIETYSLDRRRVAIQAGVNDWGTANPNGGLAGWPLAGQEWIITVPPGEIAPENADIDLTQVHDIVLRVTHRAGTVATNGSVNFTASCD